MKIVICQSCGDAVALSIKERRCDCGKSGGVYLEDRHTAEVDGPSHVIGLPNSLAVRATREATAWVFTEPYKRIVRRKQIERPV